MEEWRKAWLDILVSFFVKSAKNNLWPKLRVSSMKPGKMQETQHKA